MEKPLEQVAYEAYGEHPGPNGPYTTFDGRSMPKWEELFHSEAGRLTQARWRTAIEAGVAKHEQRKDT